MGPTIWQVLIVILLLYFLFGRGKIREWFGDFVRGLREQEPASAQDNRAISEGKIALSFKRRRYSFLGLRLTRPQWGVVGMVAGGILMAPLGGIGVAALGGATSIGWWFVGAIAGFWFVNSRIDKSGT